MYVTMSSKNLLFSVPIPSCYNGEGMLLGVARGFSNFVLLFLSLTSLRACVRR